MNKVVLVIVAIFMQTTIAAQDIPEAQKIIDAAVDALKEQQYQDALELVDKAENAAKKQNNNYHPIFYALRSKIYFATSQYSHSREALYNFLSSDTSKTSASLINEMSLLLLEVEDKIETKEYQKKLENAEWQQALSMNTEESFIAYLMAFPDGAYIENAEAQVLKHKKNRLASQEKIKQLAIDTKELELVAERKRQFTRNFEVALISILKEKNNAKSVIAMIDHGTGYNFIEHLREREYFSKYGIDLSNNRVDLISAANGVENLKALLSRLPKQLNCGLCLRRHILRYKDEKAAQYLFDRGERYLKPVISFSYRDILLVGNKTEGLELLLKLKQISPDAIMNSLGESEPAIVIALQLGEVEAAKVLLRYGAKLTPFLRPLSSSDIWINPLKRSFEVLTNQNKFGQISEADFYDLEDELFKAAKKQNIDSSNVRSIKQTARAKIYPTKQPSQATIAVVQDKPNNNDGLQLTNEAKKRFQSQSSNSRSNNFLKRVDEILLDSKHLGESKEERFCRKTPTACVGSRRKNPGELRDEAERAAAIVSRKNKLKATIGRGRTEKRFGFVYCSQPKYSSPDASITSRYLEVYHSNIFTFKSGTDQHGKYFPKDGEFAKKASKMLAIEGKCHERSSLTRSELVDLIKKKEQIITESKNMDGYDKTVLKKFRYIR